MNLAPNYPIDLDTLMQTRLLLVAGSGGGKSYALRKVIEETAPKVQQFIIDPEGEFASLREKHDFILVAAKDGDVTASPKTAGVLARRLLELGTSAILDLYDLRPDERQRFVKHFLDALVDAPRELWKPAMVVLDEAHVYCPQQDSAEAMHSVIAVASRGRKRGLCLVLASQRISKLHKDTAAEMQNKLIGLTTLDVDRRRAAEELGMTVKEAVTALRGLERGEFYAFGPALTREVTKIKVGKVHTTHASGVKLGQVTPPAPSAAVKRQLAKLADLDTAAAKEATTIEELRAENAKLKREAKHPQRDPKEAFESGFLGGQVAAEKEYAVTIARLRKILAKVASLVTIDDIAGPDVKISCAPDPYKAAATEIYADVTSRPRSTREAAARVKAAFEAPYPQPPKRTSVVDYAIANVNLKAGARQMLQELAAKAPAGYTKSQLGALCRIKAKGSTFSSYLSNLRQAGFVDERGDQLFASEKGLAQFTTRPTPMMREEVIERWKRVLKAGARKMLDIIIEAGSEGIHRASLADLVNIDVGGSTFSSYVSNLNTSGLIVERNKRIYANDVLFP